MDELDAILNDLQTIAKDVGFDVPNNTRQRVKIVVHLNHKNIKFLVHKINLYKESLFHYSKESPSTSYSIAY